MAEKMQETPMSDKMTERKKPLHDWSFMVMPNPPEGVREKSLQYFRDNPVSVTIRPGRSMRPAPSPAKKKTEVGVLSDGIALLKDKLFFGQIPRWLGLEGEIVIFYINTGKPYQNGYNLCISCICYDKSAL
jgi:hypothetical protein